MKTYRQIIFFTLLTCFLIGCDANSEKKKDVKEIVTPITSTKQTRVRLKNNEPEEIDTGSIIETLQKKAEGYTITEANYSKYVTAENGLLYRDSPNGKKQRKFSYGTKLEVVGVTDIELAITDKGEEIIGKWVAVKKGEYSDTVVFVFDGFLGEKQDVDRQSLITKLPVVFEKISQRGLILSGTHTIYDKKLKKVSQLTVDKIGELYITKKTIHRRPKQKGQDYCKWTNYVEVIYGREKFILSGEKILSVLESKKVTLNTKEVGLLIAKNYAVKAEDDNGFTFCNNDYRDVLIKEHKEYSFLKHQPNSGEKNKGEKVFMNDEVLFEKISNIEAKKDTIIVNMNQKFKEGKGTYKLKLFKDSDWKYVETVVKREYQ